MLDKIKPIDKDRSVDRIRLGENYLRYCIDTIRSRFRKPKDTAHSADKENTPNSSYDNLNVPKEKPHDFDESV